MDEVLPGLYVGNYQDSKDLVQLEQCGVTHIVAVHDNARRVFKENKLDDDTGVGEAYSVENIAEELNDKTSLENIFLEKYQIEGSSLDVLVVSHSKKEEEKEYLVILAADTPSQNMIQFVPKVNDFVHRARLGGGTVLIHCLAGMSRSVFLTSAYIMSS